MLYLAALLTLVGCAEHDTRATRPCSVIATKAVEPPPTEPESRAMEISGYTSSKRETDKTPCIAARNVNICKLRAQGVQICASNSFPLGTRLHVEGLGNCIVLDRMKTGYTNNVDWYFGQGRKGRKAAKELGRQPRLVTRR